MKPLRINLVDQLVKFLELKAGWDSYNGKPIEKKYCDQAVQVLRIIRNNEPLAVPLSDGGIQLEWHLEGFDIEIQFSPGSLQEMIDAIGEHRRKTVNVFVGEYLKDAEQSSQELKRDCEMPTEILNKPMTI